MTDLHRELARELRRQGHDAEAEVVLQAGHELNPADHSVTEGLAILQRKRGRWKRELATLGRYLVARGEEATTGLQLRLDRLIGRVVTRK